MRRRNGSFEIGVYGRGRVERFPAREAYETGMLKVGVAYAERYPERVDEMAAASGLAWPALPA